MADTRRTIRAAMIGLGKMGISHYAILNTHPDVAVVGVCDSSPLVLKIIEEQGGVPVFSDYHDMIDKVAPDCVVISTPPATHAEITRHAITHGCHVFVEKPFCLNVEDSESLAALAADRQVANQVGYHNRFHAVFGEVKRVLQEKLIGEVYHYSAEMYGNVPLSHTRKNWRTQRSSGGGCLYEYGSHCIDLVSYLLGPPSRVRGTIFRGMASPETDDVIVSEFLHDNGIIGHFRVNWCDVTQRRASNRMTIWGSNGKIEADKLECRVFLKHGNSGPYRCGWNIRYAIDLVKPVWFYLRGEEYTMQLDHFVSCIMQPQLRNASSFADAVHVDRVISLLQSDELRRA